LITTIVIYSQKERREHPYTLGIPRTLPKEKPKEINIFKGFFIGAM
jgi:hypothetical protein